MARIGIDARFYGVAGPGRYVSNLLKNLEGLSTHEFFIFLSKEGFEKYQPASQNWHKVLCDVSWYSWKEQLVLPFLFLKYRLDLLHVPHFNFPIFYPGRIVLTIHDLIINQFSTERATTKFPLYYRFKRLVYRLIVKLGVTRAERVVVPSKYVKNELIRQYALSEAKVIITYEGVAGEYGEFEGNKGNTGNDKEEFLLCVGSMYPHKNLERLVEAFAQLKSNGQFKGHLVLIGKEDYFAKRLRQEIATTYPNLVPDIIFPGQDAPKGYLDDIEVKEYYQNALALVFPSLSEGFGLPPLEAMSLNCPVIASNSTSIPEICGEAAVYFDPYDVEDMAIKIINVIKDAELRQQLIAKGHENVKRFSWSKMAEETLKIYEDCFSSR